MIAKLSKKDAKIEVYNKMIEKYEKDLEKEISEHNKQRIAEAYNEVMETFNEDLTDVFPIKDFVEGPIEELMPPDVRGNKIKSLEKSIDSLRKLKEKVK